MIAECQECKQKTEVKSTQEYPALAGFLDFNKASQGERIALMCETCALRKIGGFPYGPYPTASFIKLRPINEIKQVSRADYEALPEKYQRSVNGQLYAVYKTLMGNWFGVLLKL